MPRFRGFFGKVPSRGDFVSAGLPRDFVSSWDTWISSSLPAAIAALGDGWLDAPVRHFQVAPKAFGADAVTGVLLPSVDKVGRRFPLTLAWTGCRVDVDAAHRLGRVAIEAAMPPAILTRRLANIPAGNRDQNARQTLLGTETFAMIMAGSVS
jgi:type VI secretion system ImpM family protein